MSSLRTLALAYLPPLDPSSDFETVCRGLAADGISRVVLQEVCGTINLTDPGSGPRLARVLRDTGLQAIACHGLEHAPFLLRQPEFDARRRIPNNIRRERSMPGILRSSTRPAAACGCRHDGDHITGTWIGDETAPLHPRTLPAGVPGRTRAIGLSAHQTR